MKKIALLTISILILSCTKSSDKQTSIYDGLDQYLVSYIDSTITKECDILSITRDSSAYYDVSEITYIRADFEGDNQEELDFFDIVERADKDLSDLALECYPDVISMKTFSRPIFKIKGNVKFNDEAYENFVVYTYNGWKMIDETKCIPETKFKAYVDVLKKKLGI